MKTHSTWLKVAVALQLVTALIHCVGLFISPEPGNDTERQMISLMDTYTMDMGASFHRSMSDLFLALSSCFSLLCLFGGLVNWALLRMNAGVTVVKAILNINVLVFGITFVIMTVFTFLPPIVLTGLILVFLLISRWRVSRV